MRREIAVAAGPTPQTTESSASPVREPESTRPWPTPDLRTPPAPSPHTDRAGPRRWQLAGLGLAAAALLIVGAVLGRLLPVPGGTPSQTPPAIAAATAPPATPGAAIQAKPTAPTTPAASAASAASPTIPQPASAVSAPTVPPRPTNAPGVLLADTFDSPEIGQLPRVSARAADYTFAYDRGEYVINKLNA